MSKLARYKQMTSQLQSIQTAVDELHADPEIQRAKEFHSMLIELMTEYSMELQDIVTLVDPDSKLVSNAKPAAGTRTQRPVKVYTNPHTQEVVRTRGGNNKTLASWRAEWGNDVDKWFTTEK